ncbi:MAG: HAMP domain-containing protein [Planctomycetes bacterium]|nr:HAMP domain-containing protein [Planctomycetota bacterium]
MRWTLRTKLTALLLVAGALPLLGALVAMTTQSERLRRQSVVQSLQPAATARAAAMAALLSLDVDQVDALGREPVLIDAAVQAGRDGPDPAAVEAMESRWTAMDDDDPALRAILDAPAAAALGRFVRIHPECREILLTDRFGRLVAASGRTSNYDQSDEDWWRRAFNGGAGRLVVHPVQYDESASSWSIDVCVPLRAGGDRAAPVIGVCKAVFGLTEWIGHVAPADADTELLLIDADGVILSGRGVVPYRQRLDGWGGAGRELAVGDMLRAAAAIDLRASASAAAIEAPRWFVIVQTPMRAAMAEVRHLSRVMLIAGIVLVAAVFVAALVLADRAVLAPLARLRAATARVAAGDLSHRVTDEADTDRPADEIGRLARDFDAMVVAVQRSHETLRHASEMKTRFLQIAGHELRSPLGYILATCSLAAHRATDPAFGETFERITEKARRLDRIIANLLKLAESGHAMAVLNRTSCDVGQLVGRAVEEMRPFAERRGQRIVVDVAAGLPPMDVDADKISDALGNLIGNAIKFTPDGRSVTVIAEPLPSGHVALRVRDEGGGIDEAEMPHIFEPFWGGRDVLKHSSGLYEFGKRGAGLGLPIARQFARLHGGHLQVSSSPQGCVFSLILPTTAVTYDATRTP